MCGECCRRYVPLVTAADAKRIQRSLSIPYERFLAFYPADYFEPPLPEDDDRLFATREGRFALGLARVEDGCIFLKGNLCAIHPFKPMVCRQYPFEPVDQEDLAGPFRVVQDPCWGLNAWDGAPDETAVRAEYAGYVEERRTYGEMVQRWNQDPVSADRTREDYLAYLGLSPTPIPVPAERR
ncbi:MAG: YkgJ family cysteine cluster protein [Chloroflexi bacterium]|nr:YkgJ family cysteine cluster protein [Chloroflexota bacterium]